MPNKKIWSVYEVGASYKGPLVEVEASSESGAGKLRTAQARALAVQDAANHHGWHNFDNYPLTLTVGELKKRWGK